MAKKTTCKELKSISSNECDLELKKINIKDFLGYGYLKDNLSKNNQ